MIKLFAVCSGCGYLEEGNKHPSTWVHYETQYYCSRGCLVTWLGLPAEKKARAARIGLSDLEVIMIIKLAESKTNGEIARELKRAESTIRNVFSIIFKKLRVDNRFEALLAANALGIINLNKISERYGKRRPQNRVVLR